MYKSINRYVSILTDKEMYMIWHKTVSKKRYFMFIDIFVSSLKITGIIFMIYKYSLLIMSTIVNMVNTRFDKGDLALIHKNTIWDTSCEFKALPLG